MRRQLEAAEAYASKHGLELDASHRDEGVSSYHGRHRVKGALASFLAKVESGAIPSGSYLLVENLDRLTREDVTTALDLFMGLVRAGITVVTLSDGREYDRISINRNWTDLILTLATMARAHEENAIKGQRVRAAHSRSKELARTEGRVWTRSGPSWAKLEAGKFIAITERAAAIRRAFALFEDGLTMGDIALKLHEEGAPPINKRGWQRASVSDILRNRAVIGDYQPTLVQGGERVPDGPPVPGYYPKIIEENQWYRVQSVLDRDKRSVHRRRNTDNVSNLFQGLCTCECCGDPVGLHKSVETPDGRHAALRCVNAALKRPSRLRGLNCTNKTRIKYKPLEAAILKHVFEIVIPEPTGDPLADELIIAQARVRDLGVQVENLMAEIATKGDARLRRYYDNQVAALDEAETEVKKLTARMKSPSKMIPAKTLYDMMLTGDVQARRQLALAIRAIVDVVDCGADGSARVILHGGDRAYWFKDGAFVEAIEVNTSPAPKLSLKVTNRV